MRIVTKTVLGLLTLGATGAVIFWRNQKQDNNKAKNRKPSDEVRQRLDATPGSPLGAGQPAAHTQATDQQKVHTDATDQRIAAPSFDMQREEKPVAPTVESAPPTSSTAATTADVQKPSATASAPEAEPVSAPSDAPAEPVASEAPAPEAAPVSAPSDAPAETVASEAPAPEAAPVSAPSDAPAETVASEAPAPEAAPVSAASDAPAAPATDSAPADERLNPIAAMSNEQAAQLSAAELAPKDDPDAGQLESDGDDRTTTDRIRSNLGRQLDMGELPRLNINVQAGGEAYLRGSVQTMLHSELVEQVVRETDGVTKVVNELIVEEGMSDIETAAQPAETLQNIPDITPKDDPDAGELEADGDDRTTTDRILSQLGRELHGDHLSRINVNTQAGGVVYLRGVVQSQEQSDRIYQLVSGIDGVGDIVNELNIEAGA